MNREEKAAIIGDLNKSFNKAKFAVVADYRGLKVSQLQQIRIELRKCNAEIKIAKNTLLKLAVTDTGNSCLADDFAGTTAIIMSYADPVAPAKVIAKFAAENDKFVIRTASLEGEKISKDGVVALSKLPSREVLLGQLLSVMNAVPTGLVRVLSGVPRTFLYALRAIEDQKGQANN